MSFFKHILFFILIFHTSILFAQVKMDSVLELDEVALDVNRLRNFTSGKKVQVIDSSVLQNFNTNNLGDLLAQNSQVFIKSYGPGNLASISIRGTNTQQTPVLWNGFNLQGPALGQIDFSLFPVNFAEDVEVQYGGSGALYGSGAIGGIIYINNPAHFDNGIHASVSSNFGSFNNFYQSLNFKVSKKKYISSVKFFNSDAKNNFPFINAAAYGNPRVRQSNAQVKQSGVLFENHYKIGRDQQINLRIWIQDNQRQVPPLMTNQVSLASLKNNFYRVSSEWKMRKEHVAYFIRTAYFNDEWDYKDPISNSFSKTHYQTSITEAETNIYLNSNSIINVGLNNTYNQANSDGFTGNPQQNRTAVFTSYKIWNKNNTWNAVASIREELIKGKFVPFTPALGLEGLLMKGIVLKGNVSRNYRVPTFNDLFWQPGGNPDLKPESGWSEEISLVTSPKLKSLPNNQIVFTLFNSNIDNWIIWLPSGTFWTPKNVQSVWSRGLESNFKITKIFGEVKTELSGLYSYVVSTNEKTKSLNDNSLKKQLIYVPIYSAQGNFSISYKNFYLNYIHTYTGNRFTSTDNTEYVKGYQLGSIVMGKNILIKEYKFNINARINNVWNKSYQVVQWQAMPMRYYQIGASIFFNQPNKH